MSDEAGDLVPQGLGWYYGDLFDDPLVSVKIKSQLSVVPGMLNEVTLISLQISFVQLHMY